jgi:hypothetical protein
VKEFTMIRRLIAATAALAAAQITTAVQAQENWVLLGSKNVILSKDSDTIDLSSARGKYSALRVVAKRRGIELSNIEVVYNEGPNHNEKRAINLLDGERTRAINPSNESRFVDAVGLCFKSQGVTAVVPAVIEVYGRQTDADARATRPAGRGTNKAVEPCPGGAAPAATAAATAPATGQVAATPTTNAASTAKPMVPSDSGEVLFGTQAVGFAVDRDVIRIGAEVGKFDKVRLRVLDNDIFIKSMKVVYANGEAQEIAYNADVKRDSRTKWLDLKGDRFIKEIQLIYNAKPNFRGQAFVEVYGQYAEGWLGPQGEGRKYNSGFVLLGAQTAGFTIDRNDVVKVGRNEGGFKRLEVRVFDQAITLFEVRVLYGNGEVDIIPANRTKIEAGGRFAVDLKGGTRIVQEIRPTYRTRIFQQGGVAKGRAVVQFWGQH